MSKIRYVLFAAIIAAGCQQSQTTTHTESVTTTTTTTDSVKKDTSAKALSDQLIVPGKSIGHANIDEIADSVISRLGQPDAGDAAMGKNLSIWYDNHDSTSNQTAIFFSRQMGSADDASRVKQIRTTSPDFHTAESTSIGSSLAQVSSVFKPVKFATYKENGETYTVYDDTQKGIAFEIDESETCKGIIIHKAGEKLSTNYLPFHANMKLIK